MFILENWLSTITILKNITNTIVPRLLSMIKFTLSGNFFVDIGPMPSQGLNLLTSLSIFFFNLTHISEIQ